MRAREELPTAVLTGRFTEAVRWASHLHADQARKGTRIAYISHLLAVSSLVLEDGGTEEEAIAGVLHDAIEDCHVAEAEIRARFGAPVAEIVVACSEDRDAARDQDWEARKTPVPGASRGSRAAGGGTARQRGRQAPQRPLDPQRPARARPVDVGALQRARRRAALVLLGGRSHPPGPPRFGPDPGAGPGRR